MATGALQSRHTRASSTVGTTRNGRSGGTRGWSATSGDSSEAFFLSRVAVTPYRRNTRPMRPSR